MATSDVTVHRDGRLTRATLTPYTFIAPAYGLFFAFMLGPALFAIAISFFRWGGLRPPEFIGIANYQRIIADDVFWISVRNTITYSASSLFVVMPLALLLAIALNSPTLRMKTFWRAVYFAPIVTSTVAISQTFLMLFSREFGLINITLMRMGVEPLDWLGSRALARIPVIIVIIWRWTGLTSIYFLAGLQGIPADLYDAAQVDGANRLLQFWHITLPQLRPMTLFVSVIVLIGSLQVFDEPQILTGGGPANATRSVVQYLYLRGIEQFRFGYAATIGFILFVSIFLLSMVQMGVFQKKTS